MVKMLPLGYATTMTTTQSYALPYGQLLIRPEGAGDLELSNDNSTFTAAALDDNGEVLTSARFAQTTTGELVVSCQRV